MQINITIKFFKSAWIPYEHIYLIFLNIKNKIFFKTNNLHICEIQTNVSHIYFYK